MKDEANNSFRNKEMEKAEGQYLEIISKVEALGTPEELLQIYLAVLNNVAATLLQLKKLDEVILYTTKSVSLDDRNIKAFYRRAMARKDLDPPQYDAALADVEKILEVETANSQALALKKTLLDLRIRLAQTANSRRDPTALGSGSHTGSLATTAGVCKDPVPVPAPNVLSPPTGPIAAEDMKSLASKYGSFTVQNWTPVRSTAPATTTEPLAYPTTAGPSAVASAITDTGKIDIMSMIQARKKAAAAAGSQIPSLRSAAQSAAERATAAVENNTVVGSVFDMLQQEEVRTKQVFKKKISRNKEIEKVVSSKPVAGIVKKKDPKLDPKKLHNQPNKYGEGAEDAWQQLGSDEMSKSNYVKQLLEEKKRLEKVNLKRAAYAKKTEEKEEDHSESDENE